MNPGPTIFVVDDNPTTRQALARLLESAGFRAETYSRAQAFLDAYDPTRPGCVLLDIRMPGMSGLELQDALTRQRIRVPVIIVSAHDQVENVVRAVKRGAVDFIKKPYRSQILLDRIHQALELDARQRQQDSKRAAAAARVATLSPREREIMDLLAAGLSAKAIAFRLHISRSTVDIHRMHLMNKLQASSVVDLVQLARLCSGEAAGQPASSELTLPSPD